jgi:ankyrin repeat protein
MVRHFLDKTADVNEKDKFGRIALWRAAWEEHKEVVQLLLKREATVTARDAIFDWTALHGAAIKGRKEVVELPLQEKGSDVNVEDRDKGTALHRAGEKGHKEVVMLLMDKKGQYRRGR